MSHINQLNSSKSNHKQTHYKLSTNRSELIELNQIQIHNNKQQNIKLSTICQKTFNTKFIKEIIRFAVYLLLAFLLVTLLSKNQPSTIYSINSNTNNDKGVTLNKQVPGIFPILSTDWSSILNTWDIVLLSGKHGSTSYKQDKYQLEFKYNEKKQNFLYITKGNCDGHILMNWQIYEHNIYLTSYVPPKGTMTIPNLPKDQECIKEKQQLINLFQYSTIWTILEEKSKTSLFLLVQQTKNNNKINYVLIADQHKKL